MSRHTTDYSENLYVRIVNPGTPDEFMAVGTDANDVADEEFEHGVHPKVARYRLVGIGSIHHTAPRYVEDEAP